MTAHADYQAYITSLGPQAFWTFQGLAPGALHDITGNGHDLTGHGTYTLANSTPLDGFQAASLDGSTAYFTAGGGGLNYSPFTWICIAFPQAGSSYVHNTEDAAGLTGHGAGLLFGDAGHNFAFGGRLDNNGSNTTIIDTRAFGAYGAGYHQFTFQFDGVNGIATVDGTVVASAVDAAFLAGAAQLFLGRQSGASAGFFKGFISDCAVFNGTIPLSSLAQAAVTAGLQTALSAPQVIGLLNEIYGSVHQTFS